MQANARTIDPNTSDATPDTATVTDTDGESRDPRPGRERRLHRRKRYVSSVTYESHSNFYSGFTENISCGGLFVTTRKPPPVGARVRIELDLEDGGHPFKAEAIVRWVRPHNISNDVPPGMGVEFIELTDAARARVNAFMQRRSPIFYDR